MKTFYWHDYETWGITPAVDRPSQFAGVRTDEDLNIIGEPHVFYCQPCDDVLPHPEACMVTGISPAKALSEGVSEREFFKRIHKEFSTPNTCVVGYNSLRFDDEVTRYGFYRNFYDPYEREWKNGNSRWDIIDMVRLVYALRPDGIEWPMVDGKPSFRLELLTQANGISHTAAHDAFSDVEATIAMAKLVKEKQPQLYQYVISNKSKNAVSQFFDLERRKPLLHISSKFSSERGCAGLVIPLMMHPTNSNAVVAYDLSIDPEPLLSLNAEQIHERVFTSQDALGDTPRIPLKLIHLNKCPIVATPKLLDQQAEQRLGISKTQCEANWHKLRDADLVHKLETVYKLSAFDKKTDPEQLLYDGFLNGADKPLCREARNASEHSLADMHLVFEDKRLTEIFERYRARNAFQYLSHEQQQDWRDFVRHRLSGAESGIQGLDAFFSRLDTLSQDKSIASDKQVVLGELRIYGQMLCRKYGLDDELKSGAA